MWAKHNYIVNYGLSIYDYAHIGNFRAYIFEDILRRYLKYKGFKVIQVMNITDVDDKTIKGSREKGISLEEFTEQFIEAFFEDLKTLNIEQAEHYPRATHHIKKMETLIKKLLEKGYAYKSEDNSIYFKISKFKKYGKLSNIKIKKLKTGARVKQDEYEKEQAQDFALWKAWDKNDGNVYWETDLNCGRPGWHIECSAMSIRFLGETFDIHTGGIDNIFPHHENEIAQSEAATGKKFVNYWLHCEHLLVNNKKMSKSLGNFYTLRDLLEKGYNPRAIRWVLISTHYRQPLNFTFESLDAALNTLDRLDEFMLNLKNHSNGKDTEKAKDLIKKIKTNFEKAMDNDLNISKAIAVIFEFIKEINILISKKQISKTSANKVIKIIKNFDKIFGILKKEKEIPKEILNLIEQREKARKNKDWKKADKLRNKIRNLGYQISDTKKGPIIKGL